jgi:hypothetical protein
LHETSQVRCWASAVSVIESVTCRSVHSTEQGQRMRLSGRCGYNWGRFVYAHNRTFAIMPSAASGETLTVIYSIQHGVHALQVTHNDQMRQTPPVADQSPTARAHRCTSSSLLRATIAGAEVDVLMPGFTHAFRTRPVGTMEPLAALPRFCVTATSVCGTCCRDVAMLPWIGRAGNPFGVDHGCQVRLPNVMGGLRLSAHARSGPTRSPRPRQVACSGVT